jgi:hypothetical protein
VGSTALTGAGPQAKRDAAIVMANTAGAIFDSERDIVHLPAPGDEVR